MANKTEGKKKNNGDDPQDGDPKADTKEHQSGGEDMIAERGRSSPSDHGGGRRLAVKQSEKKDVGQTGFASISTTPIQKDSKLMQSKVEATSKRVSNNDTPTSHHLSTDHPNQEKKNKKEGKKKNKGDDPQDGDPREDTKEHQSGQKYVKILSYGFEKEPVNRARFPVLDENTIAERGRSSPPDHGGGRRIAVKQSEKKDVGQTRYASRGIAISTTPIQKDSKLMQSKVEATSKRVSNNDTPTPRHLSTDHPNQEKEIGCMSMFVPKKDRKKTTNHAK